MTPPLYFLLLVSIGIPTRANEQKPPFRLQILHNADLHVRFEETYGIGGFARMKQAIQDAKNKAAEDGIPTIILNAGDNFQGTAYFTVFKDTYVTKFVRALGFDVMVNFFIQHFIPKYHNFILFYFFFVFVLLHLTRLTRMNSVKEIFFLCLRKNYSKIFT